MPRVIILGYGKMGRIHAKHLAELGVAWNFFDPFVKGGVQKIDQRLYSHAIVATPIESHIESYRYLVDFPGRILIEKPVVVRDEHLGVLDDPRVFPGMVERFNPAVAALEAALCRMRLMTINFYRTSITGAIDDIGIHDLDLFVHVSKPEQPWTLVWEGTDLVVRTPDVDARFAWRKSSVRQTRIECTTSRGHIVADLHAQTIDGRQLPHGWPIRAELQSFLAGDTVDAKRSHRLLIDCLRLRDLNRQEFHSNHRSL
jgi:hypothetical protein